MVKFCHDAAILIQESIFQGQLLHLVLFDPAEIHSVHFLVDTMQIICSPTKNKSHRYQNYDTFQLYVLILMPVTDAENDYSEIHLLVHPLSFVYTG
jgi:hypothetical protein